MTGPKRQGAAGDAALVRAGRLLAWYPRRWRERYGDEFAELLAADLAERGPSWRSALNVAGSGLRARLAGAGLAAHPLDQADAAVAGLAVMTACAAAAVLAAAQMWAQLATGLQWSAPGDPRVRVAMDLLSAGLAVLMVLAAAAAAPVGWTAVRAAQRGQGRRLAWPAALLAAGAVVLVTGARHFQNGWPGTGGHLLAHQGPVPGGLAAFGWAATMWITSYWAHPAALAAFPAAQLAWLAVSPAAAAAVITGAVRLLRESGLSPGVVRYQARLSYLALAALACLLAGAACWLAAGQGAGAGSLRAGAVYRGGLAVVAVTAIVLAAAVRRAAAASRAGAAGARGR